MEDRALQSLPGGWGVQVASGRNQAKGRDKHKELFGSSSRSAQRSPFTGLR